MIPAQPPALDALMARWREESGARRRAADSWGGGDSRAARLYGESIAYELAAKELAPIAATLAAEQRAREEEILHWKTCSLCGEVMTAPGHCDSAESERVKGLEQMHEEALDRAEAAEHNSKGQLDAIKALTERAETAEAELAAERETSLNDPAEQRAERYALEASDLAGRLAAAESRAIQLAQERDAALDASADPQRMTTTTKDDDLARSVELGEGPAPQRAPSDRR